MSPAAPYWESPDNEEKSHPGYTRGHRYLDFLDIMYTNKQGYNFHTENHNRDVDKNALQKQKPQFFPIHQNCRIFQ